ncbi:U1 small nuclear ribonucleoprotein 70 kDa-like [Suricata suricatta]|uniref:U1 small nuclear ribonucleoprotein 70 kDa-like n=1 Tax=Suricata suricatta TaxID=37032 RepID=UPI0011554D89|nr:U1 small nuclear ribonucleoprotein 70 kDa-like [Suricata suricatta]
MTKQSRLPNGDRARSRSSPGWQDRAAVAAASRPGAEDQPPHRRRGGGGGGGGRGGGRRGGGCARPRQPSEKQLTQRRGARLLPGEHAPATGDGSSVREKACAPPPGFRARS